ncbi:amino acid transporter [Paucilactobacillus vaccinostercus DSM 20634]|jgi:Amino acid transporters|uniref:Amino acid transporter n=1 Tax=Paucilactobacillus vaccinostercus DSM 20634 TaxID=1423813 RepID=A0A0R2ADL1_9LACO|nr:amino acid permease [Paucilactobacillus vaccinostercus]KRM61881.1 amino acid transporter [Paucilactobacillus vaccinostercus DSM 20634]RRG09249.1 MAG: amino acid permease [Lactobacillus sp.]
MKNKRSLFIRKDIATDIYKKTGLEKSLTAFSLITMGVGAIVGAGIFITPGIIAAKYTGPGAMLAFVLAAVVCSLAALCYSEFSSTIPLAGSAYTYIYAVFGEFIAWILGWALVSEYLFSVSAVAASWSAYFQNILVGLNIHMPEALTAAYGTAGHPGAFFDLPAFVIIMILSLLLSGGVRESARVNAIMVVLKIIVIVLFIVVGVFYVKPANYSPFLPFGVKGVVSGAAVAFYAYIGFDAVSTAAEEVKRPQRNVPIGIIGSLLIATVLYIALSAVLVGIVKYTKLNVADPVAYALHFIHQDWVSGIVSLGAVIGMTTVLIVFLYGGTRLVFAISRDGLLPPFFSKLAPKSHAPVVNTWVFGIVGSIFACIIPIDKITELVNIGTLFAFAMVSIGIVFLRRSPDFAHLDSAFKVPFYPVLPIISFILCVILMLELKLFTWVAFFIWLIIGLFVYFGYGYRHSSVRNKNN